MTRIHQLLSAATVGAIDASGAAIAVVATLVLFFGVIAPLNSHRRQAAAHSQTTARERQRLASVVTEFHRVSGEVAKMRAQVAASPLRPLSQETLNQRLADLAALSTASDLTIEDLKPGARLQMPHLAVVPVEMSGHGTYRNCAAFLHSLHERLADIEVSSFKLAGSPADPGSPGNFDFQLRLLAAPPATPQTSQVSTAALP